MTVLITGAGLIGSHLAKRLAAAGDKAVLYDLAPSRDYIEKVAGKERVEVVAADIRDLPAMLNALQSFNADTIVHTAGLIGSRVAANSYTGSTNNILGTLHVLEAARLLRLKRVVYVSTFGVYDRAKVKEGPLSEDSPVGGHNLYTVTKLCSEHLVHAYTAMYNLDSVIIRPAGVFGRGLYVGGSSVGMAMRDLALKALGGAPFAIDAKRYFANEYVYAKDVALALELACRARDLKQRTYNAGTGVVTTAADLARTLREVVPNLEVTVSGQAEEGARQSPVDLSKSAAELGYRPQYPLKEALKDYLGELRADAGG
ncbi:MAG TPA: NAD(P)-dependent oxidoreductase [Candidatus Acidoferrales bacterium]|nr:NAD(P)-dependent oxidoreductase [Candidatus Acidoferrales bacterium]